MNFVNVVSALFCWFDVAPLHFWGLMDHKWRITWKIALRWQKAKASFLNGKYSYPWGGGDIEHNEIRFGEKKALGYL